MKFNKLVEEAIKTQKYAESAGGLGFPPQYSEVQDAWEQAFSARKRAKGVYC